VPLYNSLIGRGYWYRQLALSWACVVYLLGNMVVGV